MQRCVLSSFRRTRDMRRWRIGLPVVAVGRLLAGCGVAHERSARSVVPDTPVGPGRLDRRQLEPERIPDELVERRLGTYPTLRMTTAELFQEFPRPDPS